MAMAKRRSVFLLTLSVASSSARFAVSGTQRRSLPRGNTGRSQERHEEEATPSCRGGAAVAAAPTMTASRMRLCTLFSGGAAGTIASCITNPLEVVKTQLQSSSAAVGEMAAAHGRPGAVARRIFQQDGVPGFFRGIRPTLVGIIPSRSVYFYSYARTKRFLGSLGMREGDAANALASGLMAGVSSNTLTNPIWVVKTRMQLLADRCARGGGVARRAPSFVLPLVRARSGDGLPG